MLDPSKGGRPYKSTSGLDRRGRPISAQRRLQAERLRAARVAKGFTMQEAADLAGVSKSTIGWAELGKSTLTEYSIKRLAAAYGRGVSWLLAGSRPYSRNGPRERYKRGEAEEEVVFLAWRKKRPSQPGWYLMWAPGPGTRPEVYEVREMQDGDFGRFLALYDTLGHRWGLFMDLEEDTRFMGPITAPPREG